MSILAAINHRITLVASGVAALVALVAVALPRSSDPAGKQPAVMVASGAPAIAQPIALPALEFDGATGAVAELPVADHIHQATPLALPPIKALDGGVIQA